MTLYFNHNSIRIVQFTDLHMGEDDHKDLLSLNLMRSILSTETPDFVVFTGDQVAGYDVFSYSRRLFLWKQALSITAEFGIPFATIFGNHDDQPFRLDPLVWNQLAYYALTVALFVCAAAYCVIGPKRKTVCCVLLFCFLPILTVLLSTNPSCAIREALLKHERKEFPSLSYTGKSSPGVSHGTSNYRVVLQTPNGSMALLFMDSGGGMIQDSFHGDQMEWVRSHRSIPSVAFMHIPPVGFGSPAYGQEPSSVCPGSETLMRVLAESGVRALFVGHDHGNSWCRFQDPMLLCYGKHSGYGGYDFNESVRGARVIDLQMKNVSLLTVDTRVVLREI